MVECLWRSPDIFRILVPLPDNPLRSLNSYVIQTPSHALILDTGFRREECRKALWGGIRALGLDLSKAALFLTHLHADHTGLVWDFVEQNIPVYMGRREKEYLDKLAARMLYGQLVPDFIPAGFPPDQLAQAKKYNQRNDYAPAPNFPVKTVEDGQEFNLDGYKLKVICTPGHTPGHMVLYLPEQRLLFSGDHILFDITPNITAWPEIPDSLSDYTTSLQAIQKLPIQAVFPAHREVGRDIGRRIDELIEHHGQRLNEIYQTVRSHPGITAYETAGLIHWSMKGLSWDEFPSNQRWFAVGETLAHLCYLVNRGQLIRINGTDVVRYYPAA